MATRKKGDTQTLSNALMAPNTKKFIGDAIPQTMRKYLTPERMARVVLASVNKTPALWNCTHASIIRSVIDAAALGLEPVGGPLAHGYLVPYKTECQFIISYQGLIELARRSGEFLTIEANPVYEKDKVVVRYGFNADFQHEPYIGKDDRGAIVGAYCMATFKNDERHVKWMPVQDIEKRRAASVYSKGGPWSDWYEEMCVKTVIKSAAKLWPKTPELVSAMSMEDGGTHSDAAEQFIDAELVEAGPPEPAPTANEKLLGKLKKKREEPVVDEREDEGPPPWDKHLKEEDDAE